MKGVDSDFADLRGSLFYYAKVAIQVSSDSYIDLRNARFMHADLSEAQLSGKVYLSGALADESTKWPEGFNYKAAGLKMVSWSNSRLFEPDAGVALGRPIVPTKEQRRTIASESVCN